MVGRDEELELLYDHLGKTISGNGGLVLISGEAGIGKTTILERLSETAAKSGFFKIKGECIPGIPLPYLPFQEAFSAFTIEPFSSRSSVDSSEPKQQASVLMDSLELLTNESAKRPLLICLEDLHWADSATTQLLHFLARNVKKLRVLIVGTYRPEDLLPSESGEVHPLQSSIRLMTRERTLIDVPLGRIGQEQLSKAIEGMLGLPIDSQAKSIIYEHSAGNPLFAVEIVRLLVSEGKLVQRDEKWTLPGRTEIKIPSTVQEVILRRMDKLSKEQRRILECASVIGEAFDPSLIAESIGGEELHILDELDTISKNFKLVLGNEDGYIFTHSKIRDVTYDAISKPKRMELHKRVGNSLEKRLPNDSLLAALSGHFEQAQELKKCVKYSLLAGKYCFIKKAVREAKYFFQLVLTKTEGDLSLVAERLEALEGLGDLGRSQFNAREWYSYYEQFLILNYDKRSRARVLAKAAECWEQYGLADAKKAIELLDEAESLSAGDSKILADIEYRRFVCHVGNWPEALPHLAKSKDYYELIGDTKGVVRCGISEIYALINNNRFFEARALAEDLLPLAKKNEDPEFICQLEDYLTIIYDSLGETGLAIKCASEAIQESEKLGLMNLWASALFERSRILERLGNLESARIDMLKALEIAKIYEHSYDLALHEIFLGLCEIELGLVNSAEHHYEEGLRSYSTLDTHPKSMLSPYLSFLRAELLAVKDDIQQSDEVYYWTIAYCKEEDQMWELMECHTRYGMSLARRGMQENSRVQFDEAMNLARKMGCEKTVQQFAIRAGIDLVIDNIRP